MMAIPQGIPLQEFGSNLPRAAIAISFEFCNTCTALSLQLLGDVRNWAETIELQLRSIKAELEHSQVREGDSCFV